MDRNELTVGAERDAMARIVDRYAHVPAKRRARILELASVVATAMAMSFCAIGFYQWANDLGGAWSAFVVAGAFAIVLAGAAASAVRAARAIDRAATATADDAAVVLDGLRRGTVASLSERSTELLIRAVGSDAFVDAVHGPILRAASDPSRPTTRIGLADATGLSESTLGRLEKGLDVSAGTRGRVARVLPDSGARERVVRERLLSLRRLEWDEDDERAVEAGAVLAGIREGSIRFLRSEDFDVLVLAVGRSGVNEAMDASPAGVFVDCLGDRDDFAETRS